MHLFRQTQITFARTLIVGVAFGQYFPFYDGGFVLFFLFVYVCREAGGVFLAGVSEAGCVVVVACFEFCF